MQQAYSSKTAAALSPGIALGLALWVIKKANCCVVVTCVQRTLSHYYVHLTWDDDMAGEHGAGSSAAASSAER